MNLPAFPVDRDQEIQEIGRIGKDRLPNEACGILLPREAPKSRKWVWELPNRSKEPRDSTLIHAEDIRITLEEWLITTPSELVNQLILWHTHPGGNIGPSQMDMKQAIPGVMFLVVALKDNDAIPTFYRAHALEMSHGQ